MDPLIYRWNTVLGQSQAAALEAEGKTGIIHNWTYTNFWEGAMAWSGWWHKPRFRLLTEVAGVRIASPTDSSNAPRSTSRRSATTAQSFPWATSCPRPPTSRHDLTIRSRWLGGHWTLRDIVDYEMTATMALLDTTADSA